MRRSVFTSVALGAMLCATAVFAQGGGQGQGGPGGPPGGRQGGGPGGSSMTSPAMATAPLQSAMLDRMSEKLELSDDQLTQLKAALTEREKAVATIEKAATTAGKALREAMLAETYNADTVKDLLAKSQKAELDLVGANIQTWTQIRSILSADQLATLKTAMSSKPSGPPSGSGSDGPSGPPPDGGTPPSE